MRNRFRLIIAGLSVWAAFVLCAFSVPAHAQLQRDLSRTAISLLTVAPGHVEVYEPFGHTGIRILDSNSGADIVFNYGTFNYSEDGFELKFMRGKLLYYLSASSYADFNEEYVEAKRQVSEQWLVLTDPQKAEIIGFLENNIKPEHRAYKYDFLFDNCATRIRDVLPKTFGSRFHYGPAMEAGSDLTFRQIINRYLYHEHLERLGINLLLGSRLDRRMTQDQSMFLPDFLSRGLAGARVDGKPVAGPEHVVVPGEPQPAPGLNTALLITGILFLLTALGLLVPSLRPLGRFMEMLVLVVSGLIGILILVMWFGTDHQTCQDNWNFLWLLPTNLFYAFRRRPKSRYAVVGMSLVMVSLLLHLTGFQALPLTDIAPLLLTLLLIFALHARNNRLFNAHPKND